MPWRPEPPFLVRAGSRDSGVTPVRPPLAPCGGQSPAVVCTVSRAVCRLRARSRLGHGQAGLLSRDSGPIRPANGACFKPRGAQWASQNLLEGRFTEGGSG